MDPLSITTGCLTLLGTIGQTSLAITSFVRSCREARGDLAEVARELSELKMVLEILQGDQDVENNRIIPESLQRQILVILVNCNEVLVKIDAVLEKHRGRAGDIRWVVTGKNEVANLRQSLEAYQGALSLVLETITLALTRQVKADTNAIRADAFDIKQEIAKIREDIERLRSFSNKAEQLEIDAGRELSNPMLQRYFDSLTTYAETVCEDIEYQDDPQDKTTLSVGLRDLDLCQPEPSPSARATPRRDNTRGSTRQMSNQLELIPTSTAATTSSIIEETVCSVPLYSGLRPNELRWSLLKEPTILRHNDTTGVPGINQITLSPSTSLVATLHHGAFVRIWKIPVSGSSIITEPHLIDFYVKKKLVLWDKPLHVTRVSFAGSDSLLYVNVIRRDSGKLQSFLEFWNWKSNQRIDYQYVGSATAQTESTSGLHASFSVDDTRLSLYMYKEMECLRSLGSTDTLHGVTQKADVAISFFKAGGKSGLVVAANDRMHNKYNDYSEGKFPQLIIIEKLRGEIRAKAILQPELLQSRPLGVAFDNTGVWSVWEAGKLRYIAMWTTASSEVELIHLVEFEDYRLILSPNGEYIAAYHNEDLDPRSHLAILDGKTGCKLASNSWESASLTSGDRITAVQFSYDGGKLAVAHSGGKLQLFHRR